MNIEKEAENALIRVNEYIDKLVEDAHYEIKKKFWKTKVYSYQYFCRELEEPNLEWKSKTISTIYLYSSERLKIIHERSRLRHRLDLSRGDYLQDIGIDSYQLDTQETAEELSRNLFHYFSDREVEEVIKTLNDRLQLRNEERTRFHKSRRVKAILDIKTRIKKPELPKKSNWFMRLFKYA
jgi:hypothetical protein